MSVTEVSVLIIALSVITLVVTAVVALVHLIPVLRETRTLVRSAQQTMVRLERVAEDLEHVSRDARRLETQLSSAVGGFLGQTLPPLHMLNAILAGARTGIGALFNRQSTTRSTSS